MVRADPDDEESGLGFQAASAAAALSLLAGSPAMAYNIMDDINAPASPPKSSEPASGLVAVRARGSSVLAILDEYGQAGSLLIAQ